ncbi:MAG: bifunctional UDP-N-acetylglucosamine diphosphorylase/glucosamine-1-phosphate N-acetyltransferase GlmU [Holosporales bacterium]|jgi:bifunctional UDP-N-acetylglucosamine pyrophosphorylase/glucosamine-1-phosphate N-acetyltransferase|nr:bifunctional UDP-N-acetylglucosamine diphosphorylase/glucosamine-1-phosphate N-acetyltransferase GlmU [Holosporales bacterium]
MFSTVFCVVLAAGKGARMQSCHPKVLHPVGGLPLLGHCIRTAQLCGIPKITAVVSPDLQEVISHFPAHVIDVDTARLSLVVQDPPRGTGEAVQRALHEMLDSTNWALVLYGDTPLVTKEMLQSLLLKAQERARTGVVLLAMHPQEAAMYARLIPTTDGHGIKAVVEAEEASEHELAHPLCNAGMLLHREVALHLLPQIMPRQGREIFLTDIVALAHANGWHCTYTEASAEALRGANTRADLAALERTFQERARTDAMAHGVTLIDPETVYFSYDTHLEPDVTVLPHVFFDKRVQVGAGSRIGPFCVLEDVTVGKNAVVGPFARLRPGTTIDDRVHVGNFVEIKNAHIEEGTKVNHLSYIGDASLGKACNIGAGTITCNYDGREKHKTIIEDGAFIGSNTALVAPVRVGKEAIIGAGSTITRDIPEKALGLTRAPLEIVSEFRKRKK